MKFVTRLLRDSYIVGGVGMNSLIWLKEYVFSLLSFFIHVLRVLNRLKQCLRVSGCPFIFFFLEFSFQDIAV